MRVAIVCDGRPEVGMGHVTRCTGLARALVRQGCQTVVYVLEGSLAEPPLCPEDPILVAWRLLPIDPQDPGQVLEWCEDALSGEDMLVTDAYGLGPAFYETIRETLPALPVMAFDDAGEKRDLPVLGVLNGGLGGAVLTYPGRLRLFSCLGPRYAILPATCCLLAREEGGRSIRRVLIVMGGGDQEHQTVRLAGIVSSLDPDIRVEAVLGPMYEPPPEVEEAFAGYGPQVTVHRAPERFHALATGCDLAITAGGVTCLEMLHLGVPVAALSVADNQDPNLAALEQMGLGTALGRWDREDDHSLAQAIGRLLADPETCFLRAAKGREVVDGMGVWRLAGQLIRAEKLFRGSGFSLDEVWQEYAEASQSEKSHEKGLWGSDESMRNRFHLALALITGHAGGAPVRSWLDVGTGPGDFLEAGWEHLEPGEFVGLDLCLENVAHAAERFAHISRASFICADFMTQVDDGGKTLVTALGVLHKCGYALEDALEGLARLAEPGGLVLACTKNLDWEAFDHAMCEPYAGHAWFRPDQLARAVERAGLELLELRGFDPGKGEWRELGKSHSMMFLARKREA